MVVIDWWQQALKADNVHENSELGGYLATKALIDAGYTEIAVITGEQSKSHTLNRLQGYKRAILEANLPIRPEWIIEGHFDYQAGLECASRLLTANSPSSSNLCDERQYRYRCISSRLASRFAYSARYCGDRLR